MKVVKVVRHIETDGEGVCEQSGKTRVHRLCYSRMMGLGLSD